jgi:hypothetical protein
MGAVAACSARSGCLRRGVVHGDGKGSAGHAGVGLGWQTGKLTFTHGPAALISYSSTSSRKSRVLIEEQDHVVIDQRHSTLQTRRHGMVGLQQGPPELAWAARSECILQPVTHRGLENQSARGFLLYVSVPTLIILRDRSRLLFGRIGFCAPCTRSRLMSSHFWPFCTSSMQSNA